MSRGWILSMAVALAACSSAATSPATAERALKIAARTQVPNDTTSVSVVDVTADSRCPTGVQCVWAGDAAVAFDIGGRAVTLHTNAQAGATSVDVGGRVMQLVSVTPHPEAGKVIAKGEYVVTVRF